MDDITRKIIRGFLAPLLMFVGVIIVLLSAVAWRGGVYLIGGIFLGLLMIASCFLLRLKYFPKK